MNTFEFMIKLYYILIWPVNNITKAHQMVSTIGRVGKRTNEEANDLYTKIK